MRDLRQYISGIGCGGSQAADLLAPVVDRTLLAHGWPALGEASLDIDV